MSNITVGATGRSLPLDRRAALRSIASAGALAAIPAAAAASDAEPVAAADLAIARRWREAARRVEDATRAWDGACERHVDPPVPDALLIREGDAALLWHLRERTEEKGRGFVGRQGLAELRRRGEGAGTHARTLEILAAGDEWHRLCYAADRASGKELAGTEVDDASNDLFAIERQVSTSSSLSAAEFLQHLQVFEFYRRWHTDFGSELADAKQLVADDSPAVLTAVRLAIDLVNLIARAQQPGPDSDLEAFVPLGAIASAIVARLEGEGIAA